MFVSECVRQWSKVREGLEFKAMDGDLAYSTPISKKPGISIVIPVHNEADNVSVLQRELVSVLQTLPNPWEICFVDDGSTDGTDKRLDDLADMFPNTKVVHLTRRFGQSAALRAGFDHTHGEIVVTMDGDLQNDPSDVPGLIRKLDDGYDIVHGWRKNRQDRWLSRRVPSLIANWFIRKTTGVEVPDLGCGIRAMRRWVADQLDLMGEMHRYLPILADNVGAKGTVVVVNHRSRQYGRSKYGLGRVFRVLCDMPVVLWLTRFRWTPMRIFALLGIANALVIVMVFLLSVILQWTLSPAISLSVLLVALAIIAGGTTTFAMGLTAEILLRAQADRYPVYVVRSLVGHESESPILRLADRDLFSEQHGSRAKPTGT